MFKYVCMYVCMCGSCNSDKLREILGEWRHWIYSEARVHEKPECAQTTGEC
jgi:hypothetical protein